MNTFEGNIIETRFDVWKEKCHDHENQNLPIDIFKRFYSSSCKTCQIRGPRQNRFIFNERTGEIEKFLDLYNNRYSANDYYHFRRDFGKVIIGGMINAMFMHIQCPPRGDAPKCEDDQWLDEVDAMKIAIEEVDNNIDERSTILRFCTESPTC